MQVLQHNQDVKRHPLDILDAKSQVSGGIPQWTDGGVGEETAEAEVEAKKFLDEGERKKSAARRITAYTAVIADYAAKEARAKAEGRSFTRPLEEEIEAKVVREIAKIEEKETAKREADERKLKAKAAQADEAALAFKKFIAMDITKGWCYMRKISGYPVTVAASFLSTSNLFQALTQFQGDHFSAKVSVTLQHSQILVPGYGGGFH